MAHSALVALLAGGGLIFWHAIIASVGSDRTADAIETNAQTGLARRRSSAPCLFLSQLHRLRRRNLQGKGPFRDVPNVLTSKYAAGGPRS